MFFGVMITPYIESYGSSNRALEKLFLNSRSLGIDALEIAYIKHFEEGAWSDCVRNLRDLAEKFSVRISMHAPVVDISSRNEQTRVKAVEKVRKAIGGFGKVMRRGTVVVHPEDTSPVKPFKARERMKNCVRSLEVLSKEACEFGVKIALENMRWREDKPRRTGMYLKEVAEIVECLGGETVGICFDVGHAYVSEGEDLYEAFKGNSQRVIHIHLHDNHGYHGDDEHLELGEGTIDLKRLCSIFKEVEYEDAVIFEVAKRTEDPLRFYERNARRFLTALS